MPLDFTVHMETALPATLVAGGLYMIAVANQPDEMEIVAVGSDGIITRRVLNRSKVQAMIDASVSAATGNATVIVDDITARDALTATNAMRVYVIDASGDISVDSGGAEYMWRESGSEWIKLSESESQDLISTWANMTGGPESTPAQIDDAVTKRHSHANKTQLDKIGEDAEGKFTYGGNRPTVAWSETAW